MMRLLLIGGPASGKGTQALRLMKTFNIPQISASEILRTAMATNTQKGLEVKKIMDSGNLVPDKLMIDLVKERLKQPDCANGYLLDGFPRTIEQLNAFKNTFNPAFFGANKNNIKNAFPVDHVIELAVPDKEAIKRISGRQIHLPSGRIYHSIYNPPKVKGIDDVSGEALITRTDDNATTIKKRLSLYHCVTEPIINYFKKLPNRTTGTQYHHIDGTKDVDSVFNTIIDAIKPKVNKSLTAK